MGASAGGLEAFESFFSHMPADAGVAFVLIQHLDPAHGTLMPELLSRHTKMPIALARDGIAVERNHIYVIPPNATLTIGGARLQVQSPAPRPWPLTPIDGFLHSLAQDQGELAVCILLSGSGTDGTLGLRAVKEQGGMAMAQTTASAKHDGIPRSAIATGLVDYVLPVEDMPARLVEYVAALAERQEQDASATEVQDHLAKICALLRRKTGHDFTQYKPGTLVRRIERRMQLLRVPSVTGYVERLRKDPREVEQLFKDVLIGVTHFFRDPKAFEILGKEIVPRILADAEDTVRIWAPGCATGEEAYSVAILIREALGSRQDLKVQIFAGDIDEEALETARQAVYPEGIANQVTPERLERFFDRHDHSYLLAKEIREMCIFSTHNLIKDPPFSRVDLIVCRNLLIYLEPKLQRQVAELFHYALRPGGYLFLGPSEHVTGVPELFHAISKTHRIFKRNETVSRPPLAFPIPGPRHPSRGLPVSPAAMAASRTAREVPGSVEVLERILLQNYSPAWVVINSLGDVVYFSPRTGRFLEPPPGAPSTNLVDMARKEIRLHLRTAIHRALQSGETVVREELSIESDGLAQRIGLTVRPVRELGEDSGLYMVVFRELGPSPGGPDPAAASGAARSPESITQQLENDLRTTEEHLQATVEQLESANQELLSTNEELQSSNEELQTSKEEMQSVNEELETINAELAKKIEQLDSAHSDLQNLFESTQIASIFLDKELQIKSFTPAAIEVFRLIQSDVGRSIADITPRFSDPDLFEAIRTVLRTLAKQERHVQLVDGSATYMARILPYRGVDNVIYGVVLTFVDVTALTRSQARQAELAAIVESSLDAIVVRGLEGTITIWNASATRMFGYSPQEAVGRPESLIVPPEKTAESDRVYERVVRGELVDPFESIRMTREGLRLPVSVAVSAIRDASGKVSGTSASFRSLAETQRAKQELLSEVRHRDQFLAMLGHELRGPLSPLRMCLEVLRSPGAGDKQLEKAKQMMERQLVHLTALVDQLLDAARISRGKIPLDMKMVDLTQLLRVVAEDHRSFIESQGPALNVDLPSTSVWVLGDPVRLTQSVGNLLHNAGKFTEVGTVALRLGSDKRGSQAVITVRDTGVGMEEPLFAELFKPFSQADQTLDRSKGGLGLGLSLTRGLIEAHHGSVEAHSLGLGRGSTFTIRLPTVQGVRKGDDAATGEGAAVGDGVAEGEGFQKHRILVIEDNADAAESLSHVLGLMGHEVSMAPDGEAAISVARQFKPEIVFCDIGLPGEMSGYAVAGAFRADPDLKNVHLVALTGYGREEDERRALQAGFELHLRKPADLSVLKHALSGLLQAR